MDLRSRVLALAGMLQALNLVRQIADTGHADGEGERNTLDSVFRIDAASAEAVYGSTRSLRAGLLILRDYLTDRSGDDALPKLGMAVLQIERRFVADESLAQQVLEGIRTLEGIAERQGSIHPEVISKLGQLYADTIRHLTQGESFGDTLARFTNAHAFDVLNALFTSAFFDSRVHAEGISGAELRKVGADEFFLYGLDI